MTLKNRVGRIPATEPNWSSPVAANYEFLTGMHVSEHGDEQRWSERVTARVTMGFQSNLTEEKWHRHLADFAGTGQDELFVLPNPWRLDYLDALADDDQLEMDPMPFWAVPGAMVVLEDSTNVEAGTISTVVGTTVTLETPLTNTFAAGSKVRPAYLVRAEIAASFEALTAGVRVGSVSYDLVPTLNPQAAISITPDTFEGRDVFVTKPNWSRSVDVEMESGRVTFDPRRGKTDTRSPRGFSTMVQKMQYTGRTAQQVEELIAFFLRQKGKRGSFWTPTWQVDLRAAAAVSSGGSTLVVSGTDFHTAYNGSPVWNTIYREAPGGYQINRIDSMVTGGGNTTLTMADTWDEDVPEGQVFSWCPRCRFATDALKVSMLTSTVGEMSLSTYALKNEAA